MSKVAIAGNASGTGTFTIAAPNSNTDRTLSLPDSAGTLLHDASSLAAANLTGTIAKARLPAGSVLQVVQATSQTFYTTTSSTYQATNLTASITPSSSTSKILAMVQTQLGMTTANWTDIALYRGATALHGGVANAGAYDGTSADSHCPGIIVYLDSPATTSSTTYTMYFRGRQSLQARVILDSMLSTITLMEIAA